MLQLAFEGPEKLANNTLVELDHANALCVPAGCDKLAQIGKPKGQGVATSVNEWKEVFKTLFPSKRMKESSGFQAPAYDEMHREDEVDAIMKKKNEELEAYVQRQQHKASARAAMLKATKK